VGIAALFDLDGTLIARNSAPLYMRHLHRTGQARRRDVALTVYYLARYKLGLLNVERALNASMAWIAGRVEEVIQADCVDWYRRTIRPYVYPEMAATVDAHRQKGHRLVILTSATRYLAEPLAADLGIPHVIVTQLVVRDGRFTGEAVRPVCYGKGKTYWAERFAAEHDVDLGRSYFYTDSITDLPVLERVGEPRVVNPDPLLKRTAQRRGWPVQRLRLDGRTSTAAMI
jgi:putative phosphoserine phosphatase/1-acylglycerol-3-phosphate O-acyltransferase